ncbi:TonB-dependent receptor [Flavobacterium gelidilacus]|uniref:SusC/RagA family TonB-linked outer membrane protein n=1 Tax=Flavobacterium gelidilacus TaxID=206041 RepID=UPI0004117849|nr:TonB-dependent receptor [Flavobacterium gelidilacus]
MKTIQKKLFILLFILPFSIFAQSTLKGTILDNLGQTLTGVSVVVKGTSNGVATDFDGNFTLTNLKKGDVVSFSYIGFTTQDLVYNNQKEVSITMLEDSQQLADVVVIGYGTVKKADATGSVATVTTKDFVKGPVVAVDQMIQGKVAGLQITNGGGAPGEGSIIRIRQGSSISANNSPLVVIDGVPVAEDNTGGRNSLATINQNDIESVTILKDASATAIYGSRASNGVIIITTKKGKSGELKINYNGNVSYSSIYKKAEVLSADQFRTYVSENGNADQIALLGTANTNWQNEIYRDGLGTDHNIALSGGADNLTYRASLGMTDMNGILNKDNYNRATTSLALVGDFFDNHLKMQFNNKTALTKNNYSNRGAIGSAVSYDPTQNAYNADGTYFQWYNPSGEINTLAGRNPLAELNQNNNYGNHFRSLGNLQTEYKLHFLPELKAIANFGYDYTTGRSYGDSSLDYGYAQNTPDYYSSTNTSKNTLMDLYLNYKKDIAAIKGSVEFTAGYNYQNFQYTGFGTSTNNNVTPPGQNTFSESNLQSVFGRGIFNLYDKYILTATIRRDGSSRFNENNRWGNFPSAALAWKLKEESFIKNIEAISSLKMRFGWGITGQQDIGDPYPSIATYNISNSQAQYQLGVDGNGLPVFYTTVRPQQYNENLKWEQTETRNVGLDFGFFKDRFTGSVDLYEKRTKDLLLYVNNPVFYGFSNFGNYNIGKTKSQGIEIAAQVIPIRTDDFEFTVGGNITLQNSKVTKIIDGAPNFGLLSPQGGIQGGIGNNVEIIKEGYAPNSFYVYEQAYGANGQPIDGVFIDRNGDGSIDTNDQYVYKKPTADIFYGLFTNLSYKNWDMSMSWHGSWGNYIYNNVDSNLGWQNQVLIRNTDLSNAVTEVLNTNFSSTNPGRYLSDYYIQDASFIRLDNVTVGYNFEKFLGTNANAKLSLGGQNLLLFTSYKGIDPEINGGIDNNIYPRPRMYTLGLNVNF